MGFPGDSAVKNRPAMQEIQVRSLRWEDPLEEGMATHSVFFPGESRGQRSLADNRPWGHRVEHDLTTEHDSTQKYPSLGIRHFMGYF